VCSVCKTLKASLGNKFYQIVFLNEQEPLMSLHRFSIFFTVLLVFCMLTKPVTGAETLASTSSRVFNPSQVQAPVFGSAFFVNNAESTLSMNKNKPVQSDYILGPGDVFLIKVRGVTNEEYRVEVNNRGVVSFSKIPSIYVAGLMLKDARQRIVDQVLQV
jgi:hypothetical protein